MSSLYASTANCSDCVSVCVKFSFSLSRRRQMSPSNQMSLMFPAYLLCSAALVEEPPREVVLKTSGDMSLQGSFSSQSVQMSASKQEASFSSFSSGSASMTEMKFASMSAQSMSSVQESFVEMSSSSFMGKSSVTQLESSTSRMLKAGGRGIPPKIEALPSDISIDEGKVLTVACAFTGEPTPEITWSCGGRRIQSQEQQGRFHIENTDDLTTLIIMDVQKQDGGLYTLSLGNEFGSDSATVNINIRSM